MAAEGGTAWTASRVVCGGVALALIASGCAAPLQRAASPRGLPGATAAERPVIASAAAGRPTVGVAFGGGSARGIAHIGVIRWLEEHRIPIDVAAGTSMGGLVGGAYATGMDAAELDLLIGGMDWDQLFGSSTFGFKNIRRKADARAYPSYLEFGLKRGIVPPASLNTGEHVELMLGRITAPYHEVSDFNDLPTPFRTVAVDLVTATEVVMAHGSLADAMRATMSLPLIFPPVEVDGRVLVDGGVKNNVPADVVRSMGADRVIAVNVGQLDDVEALSYTLLGLAGATLDAMMRSSTRQVITTADIIINVPLQDYGSLDWRRSSDLVSAGYEAAEAMRADLLPLALAEPEFAAWRRQRQQRRRTEVPAPLFVRTEGFAANDAQRLDALLGRHVGEALDIEALETDIAVLTGLDRYQTITWRLVRDDAGQPGLLVRGRPKPYAPPFMMLGLNLENTTSTDFRITTTARYLTYDLAGSGSELRLDGTIGSNPGVEAELYRPIGATPLFVAPAAGVSTATFNFIDEDTVVARYGVTRTRAGANLGVNLGAFSDVRAGLYTGWNTASIQVGDPGLPELRGKETGAEIVWRLDTQDSPAVPSRGTRTAVRLSRVFDGPDVAVRDVSIRSRTPLTQLAGSVNHFWAAGARGRTFAYGSLGTSFGGVPLPSFQYTLGTPFRLGSYSAGELRGAHHYVATGGYLHQLARLPDFLGGPMFAGVWLENGDAFDDWSRASWRSNASVGVLLDTLLGPVVIAGSSGFDGRWRTFIGIGRIFR
jgi:NTE family protein